MLTARSSPTWTSRRTCRNIRHNAISNNGQVLSTEFKRTLLNYYLSAVALHASMVSLFALDARAAVHETVSA
jgi:hypothetical protein